ncbi:hypothetical protein WJX74_006713 [Apatococcus lobatus]|uniref:Uncharacterized protein n=1 Tax=Apatococcus lobatus TaxID=904363 RepID=A0AAW1SGY3_9CHLO
MAQHKPSLDKALAAQLSALEAHATAEMPYNRLPALMGFRKASVFGGGFSGHLPGVQGTTSMFSSVMDAKHHQELQDVLAHHVVPLLKLRDAQALSQTCLSLRELVHTGLPAATWTSLARGTFPAAHPILAVDGLRMQSEVAQLAHFHASDYSDPRAQEFDGYCYFDVIYTFHLATREVFAVMHTKDVEVLEKILISPNSKLLFLAWCNTVRRSTIDIYDLGQRQGYALSPALFFLVLVS